jgi:hypothetical protein
MRAIDYPCLCLWRGLAAQMTRTTPLRRMTLHFTQIFFTDARTFMGPPKRSSGRAPAPEKHAPEKPILGAAPQLPLPAAGANPTPKGLRA